MADDLTITDLYRSISWGYEDAPGEDGDALAGDFNIRWRCALLYSALYDDDTARMSEVRAKLDRIGVWQQVVDYMKSVGFVLDEADTKYKKEKIVLDK